MVHGNSHLKEWSSFRTHVCADGLKTKHDITWRSLIQNHREGLRIYMQPALRSERSGEVENEAGKTCCKLSHQRDKKVFSKQEQISTMRASADPFSFASRRAREPEGLCRWMLSSGGHRLRAMMSISIGGSLCWLLRFNESLVPNLMLYSTV